MSKTKTDIVIALAETFGRTLSAPAAKMYVAALGGITDDEAKRACGVAVQKCKFFPSASELIELARTGGVSYDTQALVAWDELIDALNENRPSLMSPMVAAVVKQMGGFDVLHKTPIPEFFAWKRKEFLSAYTALARENPDRLAAIAGPQSEIAVALKGVPSREEVRAVEGENRKLLAAVLKEHEQ